MVRFVQVQIDLACDSLRLTYQNHRSHWRVSLQAGSFSHEESGLSLQDTGLMKIDGVVVASMERER